VAMESNAREKSKGLSAVAAMLLLVVAGLVCVAGLQHFREMKYPALPAVPKNEPQLAPKGPSWHLRLRDIPAQKAFIGFKHEGQVYIDASELCLQPDFRQYIENKDVLNVSDTRPLSEASDIALPGELTREVWWIVSRDVPPEDRIFDTPYQWLGPPDGAPNYACLFVGGKVEEKTIKQFRTANSQPVVGLMGFGAPLDVNLKAQEGWIDVTDDNRAATIREFPWLLSWMNKLGVKGVEQCGYSEDVTPDVALLPIKAKILPDSQQEAHWLAATACLVLDHWSLVMTNEDGTVSFITLAKPADPEEYRPVKVWTADIDNDGVPEFLIEAQYYEGSRYVLFRLNKNDKGGYYFTEIAGTSYEGL
jgi:hypothetical protein